MKEVIIPIGIPASGKSYIAKKDYNDYLYISSDEIRKEEFGDENIQDNNDIVFDIFKKKYINGYMDGKNMFLDATNTIKSFRNEMKEKLKEKGYNVKYVIFVNHPFNARELQENFRKERIVPIDSIWNIFLKIEINDIIDGNNKDEIYTFVNTPIQENTKLKIIELKDKFDIFLKNNNKDVFLDYIKKESIDNTFLSKVLIDSKIKDNFLNNISNGNFDNLIEQIINLYMYEYSINSKGLVIKERKNYTGLKIILEKFYYNLINE